MNILYFLFLFFLVLIFNGCFSPPSMTKKECKKKYIPLMLISFIIPENDKEGEKTYLKEINLIEALEKYKKCLDKAANNPIQRNL